MSRTDYADSSQRNGVTIWKLAGWLGGVRPTAALTDGRWPQHGGAYNQLVASTNETTVLRMDFKKLVNIAQINTYTAHDTYSHTGQKYSVYYSDAEKPPSHEGDPEDNGWVRIADVETPATDGCRGVSIHDLYDNQVAQCRFLLFVMDQAHGSTYTNYAEWDIVLSTGSVALPVPEFGGLGLIGLMLLAARRMRR